MPSENFIAIKDWKGLYTTKESLAIPLGNAAVVEGCDFRSGVSLSSERGYRVFGNLNQSGGKITSGFSIKRLDGTEINLVLWDNGTTATLYYLHTADTTDSADGEWEQLRTSMTTGYDVGGIGFNYLNATPEFVNYCLFGNGNDQTRSWNMAFTRLTVAAGAGAGTITVASTTGFTSTGDLVITGNNGTLTTVSYTGTTATTFTGVTNMPATRVLRGVAQATAGTSTPPRSNKWLVADGRVWSAGLTGSAGTSGVNTTRLYFCTVGDPTDWAAGTTPDSAGFRDFQDIGNIQGLAALRDPDERFTIWVLGDEAIATYALEYPSSTTRVARSRTFRSKAGVNCATYYGVANVLNDIWMVTNDVTVISVFLPTSQQTFSTDQIFENIRGTVADYSPTRARAIYYDKEKRFLVALRTSTDTTDNDTVIDVQLVKDETTGAYRREINTLPWAVGCWLKRGGNLLFGSSVAPVVYRAFTGFQAGTADSPLNFKYTTKRISEIGRLGVFNEKNLEYLALTGLIAPGSTLNVKLYLDAGGSRGILEGSMAWNDSGLVQELNTLNTLGQFMLGEQVLGGLTETTEDLNPFIVYLVLDDPMTAFYDCQIELSGSGAGFRVKVEQLGLALHDSGNNVPEVRKKGLS